MTEREAQSVEPASLMLRGFRYYVDPVSGAGFLSRPSRGLDEALEVVDMTAMQADQYVMEVAA